MAHYDSMKSEGIHDTLKESSSSAGELTGWMIWRDWHLLVAIELNLRIHSIEPGSDESFKFREKFEVHA